MEIEAEKEEVRCPPFGDKLERGVSKKIPKGTKLKVPVIICFSDGGSEKQRHWWIPGLRSM